jgi:hypothetical protein
MADPSATSIIIHPCHAVATMGDLVSAPGRTAGGWKVIVIDDPLVRLVSEQIAALRLQNGPRSER